MNLKTITDPKEARAWVKLCGERSPVLAEVELHVFRGATLRVIHDNGTPQSYNVTRFGKRKKNVWEPYANWYTAYTCLPFRRQGLAKLLAQSVERQAIEYGCVRLKALAGTMLGVYLHAALNHEFWGITARMEVAVDTPLVANPAYLGRLPPNGVCSAGESPWSLERVLTKLGDGVLRYEAQKKTPAG